MSYFGIPLRNGLPIGLGSVAALGTNAVFNPASLFANGEQGWIYNPSNFATLFQNSAGTTPVTAVEQPVGLQLDLSQNLTLGSELVTNGDFSSATGWILSASVTISLGSCFFSAVSGVNEGCVQTGIIQTGKVYQVTYTISSVSGGTIVSFLAGNNGVSRSIAGTYTEIVTGGSTTTNFGILRNSGTVTAEIDNVSVKEILGNHRYQATSANRPVVSARVNLLTKTEAFDNAAWGKAGSTVTANTTTAPDGTTTADSLIPLATTGTHRVLQSTTSVGAFAFSVFVKANGYSKVGIWDSVTTGAYAAFDLSTGTVLNSGAGASSATITALTNSWYRISFVATMSGSIGFAIQVLDPAYTTGGINVAWLADGTSGIFLWGADLRSTNQGVGLPDYQYVNTSTDYTSTGFPIYIKPNGSNQFMQTNSINFTATDKMTVWQGVRKLSDAAVGSLQETFLNFTVAGGYGIYAPPAAATASYAFLMTGATGSQSNSSPTTYASPITNVLFVSMNIGVLGYAGMFAKINAQSIVLTNSGAGVTSIGNFANAPIYFYMRGGSTLPFNGNDYGSIARGAASTATQITDGETWVNNLTKAY